MRPARSALSRMARTALSRISGQELSNSHLKEALGTAAISVARRKGTCLAARYRRIAR
jgi:hypothetical protein